MRISFAILIFSLLSLGSNLSAQPYFQLLKNDRHWIYTQMEDVEHPIYIASAFSLSIKGDTLLQGYSYKKIYQLTLKLNEFSTAILEPKQILTTRLYAVMREDTSTRKVFLLPFHDTISMCQPTEHLLYDFSLQEGDTLNDCVLENLYEPWVPFVPTVDSIRPIIFSGLETRAFYTEGVFFNNGDLFYTSGQILEGFGYEVHGLINYGRNGSFVVFQYFCEGDSLDCELLSAIQEPPKIRQSIISITPNPARNIVIIQIDPAFHTISDLQISLLNAVGNVILYEDWNTVKELQIDVSNFHDGVYFLNIYGEGINATKKIIVAH